ncbi:hypothetical protein MKX01_032301 [Papaver californicum]|nr:hypothetical protein MKX01_032301 [Papaver californicum]
MGEESDNNVASAASVERIRSERKSPPLPKTAPWLVIPSGKGNRKNQAFYNICEPNNRTLRKSIPELNGKTFKQKTSHQGWCIILCDGDDFDYTPEYWNFGDCFLWNPATLQTFELPSLLFWFEHRKEYVYQDCVLSSSPPPSRTDTLRIQQWFVSF